MLFTVTYMHLYYRQKGLLSAILRGMVGEWNEVIFEAQLFCLSSGKDRLIKYTCEM